jgi:hypothetical protein
MTPIDRIKLASLDAQAIEKEIKYQDALCCNKQEILILALADYDNNPRNSAKKGYYETARGNLAVEEQKLKILIERYKAVKNKNPKLNHVFRL